MTRCEEWNRERKKRRETSKSEREFNVMPHYPVFCSRVYLASLSQSSSSSLLILNYVHIVSHHAYTLHTRAHTHSLTQRMRTIIIEFEEHELTYIDTHNSHAIMRRKAVKPSGTQPIHGYTPHRWRQLNLSHSLHYRMPPMPLRVFFHSFFLRRFFFFSLSSTLSLYLHANMLTHIDITDYSSPFFFISSVLCQNNDFNQISRDV